MTHFVLVHGGWHGGWCWDSEVLALHRNGHTATAVELPSDDLDAGAARYAQVIADAVRKPGEDIVVGHSLAGLAIPLVPQTVEVSSLVFLASLLPEPGRSWREQLAVSRPMADWFYAEGLPKQDRDERGRSTWPPDVAAELFYHDCPRAVAEEAANRLRPQSPTPIAEVTPLEAFPDVPMHYIGCREDRAVSGKWAESTARDRLGVDVTWIDGSHSPFLADPDGLADLLITFAKGPEDR
ncbi:MULTISPECIES: alpha/beta fold hydrolase [Rhodococcus]|uniref:Alpha/beta fold hydrolase n=1 Tax=Rhodococcus oxybenzonivorans TaxID=1990687 RepID=A0AAE5A6R1_9NOCA|nr:MULTISPECIES: alpha/beta fold hydrolase [Rhodococcus]MDV7241802.1 alpha/beta fold hydrolase [Rhodococcus oxybenzonivorans]MDV7265433.1 alpha/beta fold hydrolase [Rhodococcus oxybenzonivorans]MDV7273664.1 alpha/beta fold hydrolase [Rhodococcus oxybenzonivorans]MDV7334084.1 alpha/beta fold hydrolase [Rhodococcus oxybenzonivorans]MDV7343503.1 alpha/beta fold hydrolase [Rhodococcus oxybenzonivorans]